jgi:hypothetical protein
MSSKQNTHNILIGICIFNTLILLYISMKLYRIKESYEVVIPHAGGRQAEKLPNFNASLVNNGVSYIVDTKGKFDDIDISMIYLHKPSDEPMLKYYIKEKTPVESRPVPAGQTVEVYIMQTVGRCWRSTVPIVLPKEGDAPVEMEMTVADCL